MTDTTDDLECWDPPNDDDHGMYGDYRGYGYDQQCQKPLCTNSDIRHIVESIVKRREFQRSLKTVDRAILDKQVVEIAKIKANPKVCPKDIHDSFFDLTGRVCGYGATRSPDLYRQIALCAILLADAAERGEW